MRSKSNRQLLVTVERSPQGTHDRSRKDAQQKQSSVVGYSRAITARYSRQKPQGCAAKAIVSCWLQSSDHRKVLTTEAARMRSKSNSQLLITVKRSPQGTHDRSRKDAQMNLRNKHMSFTFASINISFTNPPKGFNREVATIHSKSNYQLFVIGAITA